MRPDLEQENEYYMKTLKHPTIGLAARNYLQSRGILQDAIDTWGLGWSPIGCTPPNFDNNDEYKPWTKMWGGLTIPIFDQNGKIISISRRLIEKIDDRPKYDHYPFPSRKILFGLYQNKEDIRKSDRVIITEGQFDVISSWQRGLRVVVSSFGAHCSLDHFAIVSRYASMINILYDEDNAGKMGTEAIENFPTYGDLVVNLKTGVFPNGEDLDSWIRRNSTEELFKLLDTNESDILKKKLKLLKYRI